MYILNSRKLAEDLVASRVSAHDKFLYLIYGWIFYVVVSYSTLIFSNAGRTFLGVLEFTIVSSVAFGGCFISYRRAIKFGGSDIDSFIVDFTCLLFPLSIQAYSLVWFVNYATAWFITFIWSRLTFDSEIAANAAAVFTSNADWITTLLAVLSTQLLLFARMAMLIGLISERRATIGSGSGSAVVKLVVA